MEQGQAILVTAVAGLVTTIVGFVVQLYRERRNRQWDLEDRRLATERVDATAAKAVRVAAETREVLVQKIDENTQVNKEALHAANDVARKIADINTMIDGVHQRERIKEELETLEAPRDRARPTENHTPKRRVPR